MSEKFTPGPWVANGDKIETTSAIFRARIATIDDGGVIENPEANAKLIAASPDLYAALLKIVEHDEYMIEQGIMRHFIELERAQDALRKARGEA